MIVRLVLLVLLGLPSLAGAQLPIVDAHVHYSHDAWTVVPPKEAVAILRKAGVKRALVSSSNDEGTQKLLAEAPDLIVPELRPYRLRGDASSWVRDDAIVAYVEERLKRYRYVAIGEFHLFGADAELPVPRRIVELATPARAHAARPLRRRRHRAAVPPVSRGQDPVGALRLRAARRAYARCCASIPTSGPTSPSAATRDPGAR